MCSRTIQSTGFTPAARMRTSALPRVALGIATSSNWILSAPPNSWMRTAFMSTSRRAGLVDRRRFALADLAQRLGASLAGGLRDVREADHALRDVAFAHAHPRDVIACHQIGGT